MKTSDHFIGVPVTSLPGTSVFAIPGACFQVLGGKSVSKSNHLSRPNHTDPFLREDAGEGGQKGADRCARRDGPVTERRLVIEVDAPCFVLGARQAVWTPALRSFAACRYFMGHCVWASAGRH